MQSKDLYRSLRLMLEVDHELGLHFVSRSDEPAPAKPAATTDRRGRPATATAPSAPAQPKLVPIPKVEGSTKQEQLDALAGLIADCRRCGLCQQRTKTVPGEGNPDTRIMFIGEGPGYDEDQQGRPFVGKAGQLLDKMILAMGFPRDQVFIANVVKCRPPGNRNPSETEVPACLPYLEQQIGIIKPEIICTLGNVPLKALKPDAAGITRERGKLFTWNDIKVIPTFHPSYLLRNEAAKKPCWTDLKAVLAAIGLEVPKH